MGSTRRGMKVIAGLAVMGLITACGSGSDSGSPDEEGVEGVEQLTIAVPTPSSGPQVWYAQASGAFEEAGVAVTFETVTAPTLISAVLTGQADVGIFPYAPLALTSQQGKPTSVIYALYTGGVSNILASGAGVELEDIESAESCKIATLPQGTGAYFGAKFYAEKYNADCEILPLQTPDAMSAAVERGDALAAVGSYGAVAAIEARGGSILVDTRDPEVREEVFPIETTEPDTVMFVATEGAEEKSEAIERFIKGMDLAYAEMKDASDEEIAEAIKTLPELEAVTPEAALALVQGAKPYLPASRGYITEKIWERALGNYEEWEVPGFTADMAEAQYDEAIDMSYFENAVGVPE